MMYILSILLNAIGDGLNDSSRKVWGHNFNALHILVLLLIPFFVEVNGWHVAMYILLRIALFDVTYNISRGLKWSHIGNSSWWDKFWKRCPPVLLVFLRLICLVTAVTIQIKYV